MRRGQATVIIPGSRVERGTPVPDWDSATHTTEDGWRFVPLSSDELTEFGRQGVVARLRGSGPYDTALTEHCRVEVAGRIYEVHGSVDRWPSLSGDMAHTEVVLSDVQG